MAHPKKAFLLFFTCCMALLACGGDDDNPGDTPVNPPQPDVAGYVIEEQFEGETYWVVANGNEGFLGAFLPRLDNGQSVNLLEDKQNWPAILTDDNGNTYDFLGKAISGPDAGSSLTPVNSQLGYFFGISAFYQSSIYPAEEVSPDRSVNPSTGWSVDLDFVFRGAFQGTVPDLTDPGFQTVLTKDIIDEEFFVKPTDRVIVIRKGNTLKVYPHKILDHHEVVNDELDGERLTISYSPWTGTSAVWLSEVNGRQLEFGITGLLFNNNLIMYDKATDSRWLQMKKESVNGPLKDASPECYLYQDVYWSAVEPMIGEYDVQLLSLPTGFDFDYSEFPYGDYRTNDERVSYPLTYSDTRIPGKEIVLGVIVNDKARIYRF